MSSPFTDSDLQQLKLKGISRSEAERRLNLFSRPFQPARLVRPCTVGDGILPLEASGQIPPDSPLSCLARSYAEFIASAESAAVENRIEKFVPASGAATRMFSELQWACRPGAAFSDSADTGAVREVLRRRKEFAFANEWEIAVRQSTSRSLDDLEKEEELSGIFRALLNEEGLNYQNLPKAVLSFHQGETPQTPLQEHLKETAALAGPNGRLHCTISEEHRSLIEQHIEEISTPRNPRISLSVQDPFTDTIVVTPACEPFRTEQENLIFRPGGHGALLLNLQHFQSEIVFIKNVDNVVPEVQAHETWVWSKLIIGILNKIFQRVKGVLTSLDTAAKNPKRPSDMGALEEEAYTLFGYEKTNKDTNRIKKLFDYLNRPVRVCAMVPNQDEPGGGPFWIKSQNGTISKQIVESSQVDLNSEQQAAIWRASTHFNPVLIACGLNDYKGSPFTLTDFVDNDAGIINKRDSDGHDILTMELPGLWNGSMADWLTIFVEVPISNFNPVKTILDLLRPRHLA